MCIVVWMLVVRALPLALLTVLACGGTDQNGRSDGDTTSGAASSPTTPSVGETNDDPGGCGSLASCDSTCVDVDVDPEHCGGCDQACADGLACIAGECSVACGASSSACGDRCIDTQIDPGHCGGCDLPCGPGVPCIAGTCTPSCAAGQLACAGVCVNEHNDEANCGACEAACQTDQPCVFGECVATTLHHLLITGQSLSTGTASEVLSVAQPYANVMLNTGVRAGGSNLTSLVPLVESLVGGEGETIASSFANLLTSLTQGSGAGVRSLASAHGVGGQPYSVLRKGTQAYANGMAQVAAGALLAAAAGETHTVRAMAVIHGESDHLSQNQDYDQDLLEWHSDYEADVRALTGQRSPVVMFTDQMSSFTALGSSSSTIPVQQLAAAKARPDRVFIVAPKYMLPYAPDGVHLVGDSERLLGELYAKAWRRVLIDGEPWLPLSPRAVSRVDNEITIEFNVPAGPLVLDTTLVSDPGNFGFGFSDSSAMPPAILSVEIVNADSVRVTLASTPTGGNQRLLYAMSGSVGAAAGPTTGARGNLRDSDATASPNGYPLYNWCVHFDEPVQ